MSRTASAVRSSIAELRPRGSTNVQAGLDLGVRLANQARLERPDAYNYVILMSDGVANVDATNPFAILESAYDRDASNPLRLITIGVGIGNYNDVLLEQLAQHVNGWYRYLDDTDQARATFSRDNWLVLSTPFADQTRAQVTWDPEVVKSWRIIGYENRVTSDESFAQDRKEFAEIHSGAATTVFYELELHERAFGTGDVRLGRVELRWVVPDTGQSRGQQAEIVGRIYTGFRSDADPLLQLGAIVALAADRYSVLPDGYDGEDVDASGDLSRLFELLGSLRSNLGGLDAYRDFSFLLGRMVETASTASPPGHAHRLQPVAARACRSPRSAGVKGRPTLGLLSVHGTWPSPRSSKESLGVAADLTRARMSELCTVRNCGGPTGLHRGPWMSAHRPAGRALV